MASPKDKELGVRSPFRWRVGLDFENFEGVNKERPAGAIRDTQSQSIINMRLSGGEARLRGGQEAVLEAGVNGCLYGMIDVDGGLGIFYWNNMDSGTFLDLPCLNSINAINRSVNLIIDEIIPGGLAQVSVTSQSLPRRAIMPFAGRLLMFGSNGSGTMQDVYDVSLPTNGVGTGQATLLFSMTAPCDFVVVEEPTNSGTNRVAYISTYDGTGTIYRYDGVTLETEATGVGSERGILFLYAGEICQASTNSIVRRNDGAWNDSIAMPGGLATFRPSDAVEYQGVAFICGNDAGDSNRAKVVQLDGSTATVSFDPGADSSRATAIDSDGAFAYFAFRTDSNIYAIYFWDGLTWEEFAVHSTEAAMVAPGDLKVIGGDLYWWTPDLAALGPFSNTYLLRYSGGDPLTETVIHTSTKVDQEPPFDMNVF